MAKEKVQEAAAAEEAKEVYDVLLLDVYDNVLGKVEFVTFPTKADIHKLLTFHSEQHGKALEAKIDKRYTL